MRAIQMEDNTFNRRRFLRSSALGTLAMVAGANVIPTATRAAAPMGPATKPTADTLIVLWMAGGMAMKCLGTEVRALIRAARAPNGADKR